MVLPVVDFVFPWFHLLLIRSNKLLQYPFTLNCALFIIPSICSVKATKSFNPTQFEFWLGSILTVNQCGWPSQLVLSEKRTQAPELLP